MQWESVTLRQAPWFEKRLSAEDGKGLLNLVDVQLVYRGHGQAQCGIMSRKQAALQTVHRRSACANPVRTSSHNQHLPQNRTEYAHVSPLNAVNILIIQVTILKAPFQEYICHNIVNRTPLRYQSVQM